MPDNKKYYYLKLKDNYFDQDNIKVLESLPNGHLYSLIILKLYTKACKYNGQLKMTESIPYDPKKLDILAQVINHDKDNVKEAIKRGIELGLISMLESGEMWMTEIQNYIGHSSSEGDRKREYRIKLGQMSRQISDNHPPEKEIEIEIEIKKEIEQKKDKETIQNKYYTELKESYKYWEDLNLMGHKESTIISKIKKKHHDIYKDLGERKILDAIRNYNTIIKQPSSYWFTYKFTFWRFIEKIDTFLDSADPLNNYKIKPKDQPNEYLDANEVIKNAANK
jgi:predicted phage replisome organizer